MRLSCPNCDAQYEVPPEVIPAGGRDVQCSNCGNTWFQAHPDDPPAAATPPEEAEVATAVADEPAGDAVAGTGDAVPPSPDSQAPPPEEQPVPPAAAQPPRRKLDPGVADVLRQEAAYEARHRAAEADRIETQQELGLDALDPRESERRAREADARANAARARAVTAARATGHSAPPPPDVPEPPKEEPAQRALSSSRRDLLPDVDEINHTLRPAQERRPVETAQGRAVLTQEGAERAGFGRGFLTVFAIGVAAILLYVFAPAISRAVPPAAPALAGYAAAVDDARDWLDARLTGLLTTLDGMSSEAVGNGATAPEESG